MENVKKCLGWLQALAKVMKFHPDNEMAINKAVKEALRAEQSMNALRDGFQLEAVREALMRVRSKQEVSDELLEKAGNQLVQIDEALRRR